MSELWLAPLRGVTIRAFRDAFAEPLREAGFQGAFAPFIPANPGIRVNDRMLDDLRPFPIEAPDPRLLPVVPQVITKDPDSMRILLKGFKDRGFDRADLNSGCPFPMIRRRGRGSGLFKTPDVLERLLEAGCEEMGPGKFSLKIRLGLDRPDELLQLMPMINRYPLAVLTVHARTARQMYDGNCDWKAFAEIAAVSKNPLMLNGDVPFHWGNPRGDEKLRGDGALAVAPPAERMMIGRSFVRALGGRDDARELLRAYIELSRAELCGDHPVLGRMKELLAYWCEWPEWQRLWPMLKICRTVEELLLLV